MRAEAFGGGHRSDGGDGVRREGLVGEIRKHEGLAALERKPIVIISFGKRSSQLLP